MPRTQRSVAKRARHKKWIGRAKGYRGRRNKVFKLAKEAVLKAGQYAYRDRRKKKTTFRQQWQIQINAAARQNDTTYSKLMNDLKESGSELDRKVLAQIASQQPDTFTKITEQVKAK